MNEHEFEPGGLDRQRQEERAFLSSLFSDETELCRIPAEPDPGQRVAIRLRVGKAADVRAFLIFGDMTAAIPMEKDRTDGCFTWYRAEVVCLEKAVSYCFLVEKDSLRVLYQKGGARFFSGERRIDPRYNFRFTPGFHTPAWAKGAVQYQIFVDRFCNGDPSNDVVDNEYNYVGGMVRRVADWNSTPVDGDFRHFYGGDLLGVEKKLDYLQSLGVEVLYLNPIFLSPSSHKYDTQDYEHVDPHFGVIQDDIQYALPENEYHNVNARQYIRRVTSEVNLRKSDELFARLCGEIHRRGMRIILDGVFNHCGSFHRWMDREGIYSRTGEYAPGAYQSGKSRYRSYFRFQDPKDRDSVEGWWGYDTLPKLNYEGAPDLCARICDIACRWASPPYSIDGWRLDVAADLGHSREFNHAFWQEFRRRLKAVNPDLLILAEHYGDPSPWLQGDQWDSVMNYDAFMEPVTFFLTGMEKHSDQRRDDLYQNGEMFFETMRERMASMEWTSLQCAMNELSNHDHSRFLTRTNRTVGRLASHGSEAAMENIDKRVFRAGVVIQMTWPGAPTIYYADEAGQVGWTDPDCRRSYPWGGEDRDLIRMHKDLTGLRKAHPVLRGGSLKPLAAGMGYIAYARFDDDDCVVTAVNNADQAKRLSLPLRDAGGAEGERFVCVFRTLADGYTVERELTGEVRGGTLPLELPPRAAVILVRAVRRRFL